MSPSSERPAGHTDGVKLVYSTAGTGESALVFIHGGLADRTFYDGQLRALAGPFRVVALDLAGHGESGANREKWGIPEFARDVKAVVDAEALTRVFLFGNSLGGPVAVEAALLLPDRVLAVVGVDTFQRLDVTVSMEEARQRAEACLADYEGTVQQMVGRLFHPDVDAELLANTARRMQKTPPSVAHDTFLALGGYELAPVARQLAVPLRAINGDLYPTDVDGVRAIKTDFEVIVMEHVGHYPMLERPIEFNRQLQLMVRSLNKKTR